MLEKILPRRLDIQIAFICGILMLVFVSAYVLYEARKEIAYVIETIKLETKSVTKNIALTSTKYLVIRDYSSLENLLVQAAEYPGVIGLQIADKDGNVVSDIVNVDGVAEARFSVSELLVPDDDQTHVEIINEGSELIIFQPIVSGFKVGWVRLHYSLKGSQLHAESRFRDYMIDVTVLTIVLISLLILFLRRPMKMLKEAADFAGRISDKTGEKIPVCTQSVELQKLSLALNNASENLSDQEQIINKALNDLEMQKRALDEHSIVVVTDALGAIKYANEKFLTVTGYEIDELTNVNLRILNSGYHDENFFINMWTKISSGQVWSGELLNSNKSGGQIWLNASIIPFVEKDKSDPYQYVLISTDITALKSAEHQLALKNKSLEDLTEHLEDKVKKRTSELEAANTKLMHLNKIKSEFVSVVSHELRTPLTSIKSFAEILEDDGEDLDVDTRQRYLRIINDESDRLGRLINDVLDLQKIDAGMMSWNDELIDLEQLIENTFNIFEHAIKRKDLTYDISADGGSTLVEVDTDKLTQVVSNIISNALKFTDKGEISATIATVIEKNDAGEDEPWIVTRITDTGSGIPFTELENIFKRFHQIDISETREQGGSGLGLNICKEIIEHYNGKIWAESKLGNGSSFCFKLRAKNNGKT